MSSCIERKERSSSRRERSSSTRERKNVLPLPCTLSSLSSFSCGNDGVIEEVMSEGYLKT